MNLFQKILGKKESKKTLDRDFVSDEDIDLAVYVCMFMPH